MKKVILVISALLVISVATNIVLYNKSRKADQYEVAVDTALGYFVSEYRIGAVHETLEKALSEQRLNYGEPGKFYNSYRDNLKKVSTMHRQLTLLYGPIFEYEQYDEISSIGTYTLFNLLEDCSMFLEILGEQSQDSLVNDGERQYLDLGTLEDEMLAGLKIVTEITGELDAIYSSSYDNKSGSDLAALKDYLSRSADYFTTPDVQEKSRMIESLNSNGR